MTLTSLWAEVRARRQERQRRDRLRRELLEYRTSAERHELQAILGRYDTTLDDLLAGGGPAPTTGQRSTDRDSEEVWASIALDPSVGE